MRVPIYSLRTVIITSLTVLILLAMLLINVVMMKVAERDLVDARLRLGRLLITSVGARTAQRMGSEATSLGAVAEDKGYRAAIYRLLRISNCKGFMLVDRDNTSMFETGMSGVPEDQANAGLRKVLASGTWSLDLFGRTWGVIWFAPQTMQVSRPILLEGDVVGGVSVFLSLTDVYSSLRRSEKAMLVFIGLNTLILVLFGLYLLSQTVVKPIHSVLRVTDKFEGDGQLPLDAQTNRSEIGQLYRSLNGMVKRLAENKQELKSTIASLETANVKIRQTQDEIIKSEKLASVGRLSTGIAHEIGNPIGIILGYVELLKGEGLSEDEKRDFLNRVESEVARINRILRELLDFARPSATAHEPLHCHILIEETLTMLRPQPLLEAVEISLRLDAEHDLIEGNADKFKQVMVNIVMNAADAMAEACPDREGGVSKHLTVKTENRNETVVLSVSDSGTGIPASDMAAIFDPFFTTKDPGKGTGLGLSVCHTIIDALGGTINVESTPGEGTTVWITLPLITSENQG